MTTPAPAAQTQSESPDNQATAMIASLSPVAREEFCKQIVGGSVRGGCTAWRGLLAQRFGHEQTRWDQVRLLFFAAPLARKMVLSWAGSTQRVGVTDVTFAEVKSWMWWLERMDPLCARMIDLFYFAGLSIKEIAIVLRLPPSAIMRELRFARSWLCVKEPPAEGEADR